MIKCLTYSKIRYESDLCINEHSLTSSENKAWKKFRPWLLQYQCSALPTELTSQLGAGHFVGL